MTSAQHELKVYESLADLIASPANPTPMIRVNGRINANPDFRIYVKLERYNPLGSIKDRIALAMLNGIDVADGHTLIEPSSGNTGIALAALANAKGIPIQIAVPRGTPNEKKVLLRLLGVDALYETDDNLCPLFPNEGARGLVNGILRSRGGEKFVNPNQYENELNVRAHYTTTGPEIWHQTQGQIKYFFAATGTCGTITGVGKYLKEQDPEIQVIGVEPAHTSHNIPGMKRISDLPDDLVPKILNADVIDSRESVEDDDAYLMALTLARKEGILVGPSTGAILHVALQYAKTHAGVAVVISPDDAFKYVSHYERYVKDAGKPRI